MPLLGTKFFHIDSKKLYGENPTNPAIFKCKGTYHVAYRSVCEFYNNKSTINISPLVNFQATEIQGNLGEIGEDCRAYEFNNRLFISYALRMSQNTVTQQLMELNWDFYPLNSREIMCDQQQEVEKNWLYFTDSEHKKIYCCYHLGKQIYYHFPKLPKLLETDASYTYHVPSEREEFEPGPTILKDSFSNTPVTWKYGEIRGGAPPVQLGDELWWFFHSGFNTHQEVCDRKIYVCGFLITDGTYPFKPKYISSEPILWPTTLTEPFGPFGCPNVFVCGAVRSKEGWLISYGENDLYCKLALFNDKEIDDLKVKIK